MRGRAGGRKGEREGLSWSEAGTAFTAPIFAAIPILGLNILGCAHFVYVCFLNIHTILIVLIGGKECKVAIINAPSNCTCRSPFVRMRDISEQRDGYNRE